MYVPWSFASLPQTTNQMHKPEQAFFWQLCHWETFWEGGFMGKSQCRSSNETSHGVHWSFHSFLLWALHYARSREKGHGQWTLMGTLPPFVSCCVTLKKPVKALCLNFLVCNMKFVIFMASIVLWHVVLVGVQPAQTCKKGTMDNSLADHFCYQHLRGKNNHNKNRPRSRVPGELKTQPWVSIGNSNFLFSLDHSVYAPPYFCAWKGENIFLAFERSFSINLPSACCLNTVQSDTKQTWDFHTKEDGNSPSLSWTKQSSGNRARVNSSASVNNIPPHKCTPIIHPGAVSPKSPPNTWMQYKRVM